MPVVDRSSSKQLGYSNVYCKAHVDCDRVDRCIRRHSNARVGLGKRGRRDRRVETAASSTASVAEAWKVDGAPSITSMQRTPLVSCIGRHFTKRLHRERHERGT